MLWADSDPILPLSVGERFAEAIGRRPPVVIEDAGHFLQEDQGPRSGGSSRSGWHSQTPWGTATPWGHSFMSRYVIVVGRLGGETQECHIRLYIRPRPGNSTAFLL